MALPTILPGNLSMLDAAALQQPDMMKKIMDAMFKGTLPTPMEYIPTASAQALSAQIVRITDAGSPAVRDINAEPAVYKASLTTGVENLKIIANTQIVDKVLLEQKNFVTDPLEVQTRTYAQAVRAFMNHLLINGNPGTTVAEPSGLDYRLRNDATFIGQSMDGNSLALLAVTDAEMATWLELIDNAIARLRGQCDMIIVNLQTWLKFRSALRTAKLLATTRDSFDREITMYGTVKMIDAGQKPAGLVTGAAADQVIGNDTQTSIFDAAVTASTPMYFLSTNSEEGFRILQMHPLRVERFPPSSGNPSSHVLDWTWPVGFYTPIKFCIASVQELKLLT